MKKYKSSAAGFTLLEVAIVILIGGVLIGTAAAMLLSYMQETRLITTQSRMSNIDNAVIQYINVNGQLPCPASLTDAQDTPTFGRGLTDTTVYTSAQTDCWQNAGPATGTFQATGLAVGANTGHIVVGAVPVRSLNLPDTDMVDAWGNRFLFSVTDYLTVAKQYDATLGSIQLEDSNGNLIAPTPPTNAAAQYVILSYGADGAGAYMLNGKKSPTACPAGEFETVNCDASTATFGTLFRTTMLNSTKTGAAQYYDDFVTFHTSTMPTPIIPTHLIAPFQGTGICPGGWQNVTTLVPPQPDCSSTFSVPHVCCMKE